MLAYSRTRADSMAGFHHPGDPYFPNQGNNGWLEEEEPEEEQQGIQFHQALVAHGMLVDEPGENPGEAHDVGPDEYVDTDYEFGEIDDDDEEGQVGDQEPVLPCENEAQPDHPAPPVNPLRENRSLEAEIAALRQQLYAMEARAVRAEHERDEVIGDMAEMTQLLAQHFGI